MFGYFAWITVCPVLMIKHLGYTALEFGTILLSCSFFAFIFGSVSNRLALENFPAPTVFAIGWVASILSGSILITTYYWQGMSDVQLISCMVLYIFSTAFLWPFHETSGYASALYGCSQISGASLAAFIVSFLPENDPIPLGLAVISSAVFGWLYYLFVIRPYELAQISQEISKPST